MRKPKKATKPKAKPTKVSVTDAKIERLRQTTVAMSDLLGARLSDLEDKVTGIGRTLTEISAIRGFHDDEYKQIVGAYTRMAVAFNAAVERLKRIENSLANDISDDATKRYMETLRRNGY